MKKYIGTFSLGAENVRLYVRSDNGGSLDTRPDGKGPGRIVVGIDDSELWQSLGTLLHEANEMAYIRMGLRYCPSLDYAKDNGAYMFHMTHTQFSEAISWVAMFMNRAMMPFSKAWNDNKKRKKKK